MVKVMSTVYPEKQKEWRANNLTIGEMQHHWTLSGRGHFNKPLYERISEMRSCEQTVAYKTAKKDDREI